MGDTFRTRLKVAGNEDYIVKTRNSSNQVRLKPGEKVGMGWSPGVVVLWMHEKELV